jgi:hypothetical protein
MGDKSGPTEVVGELVRSVHEDEATQLPAGRVVQIYDVKSGDSGDSGDSND